MFSESSNIIRWFGAEQHSTLVRLFYSFSNVGVLFFMPDIMASGTSLVCNMAPFQTAVYLRSVLS